MEDRDRRRWQTADEDNDGHLNKLEFKHFLHPEESDHMRDIVIAETLDDIDKDGDGLISLAEYIGDMFRSDIGADESQEPDWVKAEREAFKEHLYEAMIGEDSFELLQPLGLLEGIKSLGIDDLEERDVAFFLLHQSSAIATLRLPKTDTKCCP